MKTRNFILFFTTVTSMALCACGINTGSSTSNKQSSEESKSSQTSSQRTSDRTSMPTYDDLDHVKLFVAKNKNAKHYSSVYAWIENNGNVTQITGAWPGASLVDYNGDWLTYDFEKQYTQFSIILSVQGNDQDSQSGTQINGVGAYWYYDNALLKDNTMPDINPPASSDPEPYTTTSQSGGDTPSTDGEGNIFHAFNWSLVTIKNNLDAIKTAGYTAIQTSPLQRPKDYSDQWKDNSGQWWKLYQPISFDVPNDGTWLGTPTDLKKLTDAAHQKGMKIIVDVVANHMGGNGDSFDGNIGRYEPDIYNNQNETLRQNGQCSDWMNRWDVTHKRMGGYPELNTESTIVQNEVYTYLKQLIDNGVDGFRFDAAKHIETPYDDERTRSDFWTNTAVKAEKYASSTYSKDIFMYGEILNETPQIPFNYYTTHDNQKLLDAVTDNKTGNSILAAIKSSNSSDAARTSYNSGLPANETVLWGESHDTYMNNDSDPSCTRNVDQAQVDKAYALVGARKGTRALYFARPNLGASIGSGSVQNDNYKGSTIKAVNIFKQLMGNNNEKVVSDNGVAYVARYGDNGYGASIVNINGSSNVELTFSDLPDGTYKDLVSNTTFTMNNHKISITFGNTGVVVIQKI